MSLYIRHLTNGKREIFTISNTGVTPPKFEIVESLADIDERIRHYAPKGKPVFCLPDLARVFGVLDLFYPNHPINLYCALPKHSNKKCIWESCKYNVDSEEAERGTCPRNLKVNR